VGSSSSRLDALAFTCGHAYPRRFFFERVLPQFQQRMHELSAVAGSTTPLTLRTLLADYRQAQLIGMACPRCVYNSSLPPRHAQLRPWEL